MPLEQNAKTFTKRLPLTTCVSHICRWLCLVLVAVAGQEASSPVGRKLQGGHSTGPSRPECTQAFLSAIMEGDEDAVESRLEIESPDCIDMDLQTPLHYACTYDQYNVSLQLLAAGALFKEDVAGRIPLHSCAFRGVEELTSLLLDAGAYIEFKDIMLRTPLHLAARNGHLEVVNLLLERGADIQAADCQSLTPLHLSARGDELINVTRFLLQRKADVNAKDIVGFSPLHHAAVNDQAVSALYLMDQDVQRVDFYARDVNGWIAVFHAAGRGHAALTDSMVERMLAEPPYPKADPQLMQAVALDPSATIIGMPWIVFAVLLICACGALATSPAIWWAKRNIILRKPYHVSGGDQAIEDSMLEILEYMLVKKQEQETFCKHWDAIRVDLLKDPNRVKNVGW